MNRENRLEVISLRFVLEGACGSAGALVTLMDNKRGRKPTLKNPFSAEVEQLRQENERLSQRLQQAEVISNIPKKASR